jgi:hypothetical protein
MLGITVLPVPCHVMILNLRLAFSTSSGFAISKNLFLLAAYSALFLGHGERCQL